MTTPQAPLGTGLSARTTCYDVVKDVDLTGKVAVVTGGYSGIGVPTVKALASKGARVVVPARDLEKAKKNLDAAGVAGDVELAPIDLADPASVDEFARGFLASGRPLHMLINSAGIMAVPLARDARGHESQLAVNHLGHFQLTCRLWPALTRAKGARVVAVSSRAHRYGGVDFDDVDFERKPYDKWKAYGQSKTANALFARALDARGEAHGVRAFSLHPGVIITDLSRHMSDEELKKMGVTDRSAPPTTGDFKNVDEGAATSVWCAVAAVLDGKGGVYCDDCDVAVEYATTRDGKTGVVSWATNPDFAERLWTLSERLTGCTLS